MIKLDGLTKRFGSTLALDALDLEVQPGEVFGFLGPNGAGKTTTIRLLLGLLHPTAGGATVLGLDPWRDVVALHRRVAYVPGDFNAWPQLTGTETLELLGRLHGGVDTEYRRLLIERFDLDVSKRGRQYSKGNRQKLALVAALSTRADLLVLDEPTSGLDPLMEVTFRECVSEAKARGQTVFLSSHILSEVEALCDRVGILRAGRLVDQGSLDDLRHLSAVTLEIEYRGPAPDLGGIDGLEVVTHADGRLRCQLQGSPDPVIKALARTHVTNLEMREPSLEELFLRYYRDAG
ncbi:MAG: ABC transporter ATP-binding protein [Actinobacteria bacterium]|nr:ABC transporter ATP-binding protein [Actinomycetota bacterium]MBV8959199.1 ABC transporter ATP-binding protein [Actinomycetota bacterium]MBV9935951.1 ABC transporter ATP-binding protein [Actinomycetota bacterium]